MRTIPWLVLLFVSVCFAPLLSGCGAPGSDEPFSIIAGSESEVIEDLITDFGSQKGYQIRMKYLGSMDQKRLLEQSAETALPDAIMPASSLWLRLGDKRRLVSDEAAIMRTPVVIGVKTRQSQGTRLVRTQRCQHIQGYSARHRERRFPFRHDLRHPEQFRRVVLPGFSHCPGRQANRPDFRRSEKRRSAATRQTPFKRTEPFLELLGLAGAKAFPSFMTSWTAW